jgi:lipopolysaccharide/colanic/teichoic acid biosynthesis glycosyltransferase
MVNLVWLGGAEGVCLVSVSGLLVADRSGVGVKRVLDVVLAVAVLALFLPVFVVIAVAVRVEGGGPVIYRQPRRGKDGVVFRIAKFRTMVAGAEAQQGRVAHLNGADWPLFKVKGRDPRVTRVGRVLRLWSLDELPQLWNVVRGEMSLVGPRPLIVGEADALGGASWVRLAVRPGMTGLWQVRGRHQLGLAEMLREDRRYVENPSLVLDLAILARTVGAVLSHRGAY